MTTEEDFHRALDANPDDHHTRLVFADWLDERGDPRAMGYRVLGALRTSPLYDSTNGQYGYTTHDNMSEEQDVRGGRPGSRVVVGKFHFLPQRLHRAMKGDSFWVPDQPSRREAEDAAALGFSKLSPEDQQEIMTQAGM